MTSRQRQLRHLYGAEKAPESEEDIPFYRKAMSKDPKSKTRFAVCINNEGYEASLEVGKLYRVLPDEEAASHGYIRVMDESGEDYGYTADRFFPLEIPRSLAQALRAAA